MRVRWVASFAVLGIAMVGFGGVGAFDHLAEACGLAPHPAPASAVQAVQEADLDLTWVPAPGLPLDEPADLHACTSEIRPGARMSFPVGCTMSWIFRDAEGALYQTTAGHCTGGVGSAVGVLNVGSNVGTVVYRASGGVGNDIALVKIHPQYYASVNPTLCHWGGPNGVATPSDASVQGHDLMLHYGWGVMWQSQDSRARAGVILANGWSGDGSVRMRGFTDGGDSGSPMMLSNGKAAGVHTHRLDSGTLGFGQKAATRLDLRLPQVEAATGLDLDIVHGLPVDLTGLTVPASGAGPGMLAAAS